MIAGPGGRGGGCQRPPEDRDLAVVTPLLIHLPAYSLMQYAGLPR